MLSLVGTVANIFGKKKAVPGHSESGFSALPPAVQEAWLKTYLPAVLDQYNKNKTFQPRPMRRVSAPQTPFDSSELYALQQYSDAVGGMFTPRLQTTRPFGR